MKISKPCPVCGQSVSFMAMRRHFSCPHCDARLGSNIRTVEVIALVTLGLITLSLSPDAEELERFLKEMFLALVVAAIGWLFVTIKKRE